MIEVQFRFGRQGLPARMLERETLPGVSRAEMGVPVKMLVVLWSGRLKCLQARSTSSLPVRRGSAIVHAAIMATARKADDNFILVGAVHKMGNRAGVERTS